MDVKQAIATARDYLRDIYADEQIFDIDLEEVEHRQQQAAWLITLAFSRPWKTPRTRAQEVLEHLGAGSAQRRTSKVITVSEDGTVLAMKNPLPETAA
jgi:hypothetical protein